MNKILKLKSKQEIIEKYKQVHQDTYEILEEYFKQNFED